MNSSFQSFKILASFCSCAGWFESYLVENPRTHCGSIKVLVWFIVLIRLCFVFSILPLGDRGGLKSLHYFTVFLSTIYGILYCSKSLNSMILRWRISTITLKCFAFHIHFISMCISFQSTCLLKLSCSYSVYLCSLHY